MTFSMSELNRTTKLLIETDEEDPDEGPQKSAKEIEEEKKAEKAAQQKMVFSLKIVTKLQTLSIKLVKLVETL